MPQQPSSPSSPPSQEISEMRGNLVMDNIVDSIGKTIPMLSEEIIYKYELEKQAKIYLFIGIIGIMMVVLGYLL